MKSATVLLILIALLLLTSAVLAKPDDSYTITRWSVSSGGGNSFGGLYTLDSTAGQAAAGGVSGGDYELGGGFWGGGTTEPYTVYLPLILRNQ